MDDAERLQRALQRLPIFPLPGAVLLPHAHVPLHVFEPRYRKMTRDCDEGLRALALAHVPDLASMEKDPVPVHPIVGVGLLARVDALPDGRFNVVLRGVLRARIEEELPSPEPYRLVRAVPLAPDPDERTLPEVIAAAQSLRRLVLALMQARRESDTAALAQLAARAEDPGDLADVIAGATLADPAERQAVLEAVHLPRRLELVLQGAASALAQTASSASAPN